MESWQPNKLVQDDADVAYEPTDDEGQRIANWLTMKLRVIMFRAKNAPPLVKEIHHDPTYRSQRRWSLE